MVLGRGRVPEGTCPLPRPRHGGRQGLVSPSAGTGRWFCLRWRIHARFPRIWTEARYPRGHWVACLHASRVGSQHRAQVGGATEAALASYAGAKASPRRSSRHVLCAQDRLFCRHGKAERPLHSLLSSSPLDHGPALGYSFSPSRARSSVGKSRSLLSSWPGVRILPGAPRHFKGMHAEARVSSSSFWKMVTTRLPFSCWSAWGRGHPCGPSIAAVPLASAVRDAMPARVLPSARAVARASGAAQSPAPPSPPLRRS